MEKHLWHWISFGLSHLIYSSQIVKNRAFCFLKWMPKICSILVLGLCKAEALFSLKLFLLLLFSSTICDTDCTLQFSGTPSAFGHYINIHCLITCHSWALQIFCMNPILNIKCDRIFLLSFLLLIIFTLH